MKCSNCNNKSSTIVYENEKMPYGINLNDKTIDIKINYCKKCSFAFQGSAYTKDYDTNISKLYKSYTISNMYSFPNRSEVNLKALSFVEEFIENKIEFNILEIGSNRGDFLYLLKEKFQKVNILGCEPTKFKNLKIPTINTFFNKDLFNTKFDLIILRHTLEHIKNPIVFLEELEFIQKEKSKIFIEVPNLIYSLKNYIEDFTPDHVNYFYKDSLCQLFNKKLLKVNDTKYLYAVFENSFVKPTSILSIDFIELFNQYNKKMTELFNKVITYDRIVFYGISNFYLWTFSRLKEKIKDKKLFFIDDFLLEDNINNLQKITNIQENDLIILCSSNKDIQKQMFKKIKKKNIYVLFPWRDIVYVQD